MSSSAAESHDAPIAPGTVVAEKYRVERLLGQGGMGVVVAATDLTLDRPVAMKVMRPEHAGKADAVTRFLREGRAAVKLTSDHVARVIEVGLTATGAPFLVMEYLDGADLGAELESRGPFPVAAAVGYLLQASEAIAEAHSQGIVHRDLKPENLFLARRPNGRTIIKVLDFGISKLSAEEGAPSKLTSTGALLGTPLYMAPEQMRSSRSVDARADIWALGVILYELLTGRPPFSGQSVTEVAVLVTNEPPVPPRQLRPEIPAGLEAVILRCLAKEPGDRFASVEALVAALEPFGAGSARAPLASVPEIPTPSRSGSRPLEVAMTELGVSSPGARAVSADGSGPVTRSDEPKRARGPVLAGGLALALLALGAGVWLAVRPHDTAPAPLPTAPSLSAPSPPPASVEPIAASPAPSLSAPPATSAAVAPVPSGARPRPSPRPSTPPPPRPPPATPTIDPGSVR